MANVFATKNGNWSDTTVWNTGALPTSADDVFSNTFTVTVNQNINVLSLRNTSATGITAGGSFNFNTSGVTATITGSQAIFNSSTVTVATITATTGSVTWNCSGQCTPVTNSGVNGCINYTGACDFYISAVAINAITNANTIIKSSSGTIYATANLVAGLNTNPITNSAGNVVVVGNLTGGSSNSGAPGSGVAVSTTAGTLTITGSIIGGGGNANSGGIYVGPSVTSVTIIGPVTGGTGSAGIALGAMSGTVSIVGNVTGGNGFAAIGSSAAINIPITGNVISSATTAAINHATGAASLTIAGGVINTNGRIPFNTPIVYFDSSAPASWTVQNPLLASRTMTTDNALPAVSDVRFGVSYGAALALTGTLRVPAANNVLSGVLVDNTVGTYATTPAAIATEIFTKLLSSSDFNTVGSFGKLLKDNVDASVSSRLATSGYTTPPTPAAISTQVWVDQPDRLKQVATVETTGDQIAALM